jgi:2',3'-cyclic-nucleotide 2'-phosphodiesterase (5'-nucleotidase family)
MRSGSDVLRRLAAVALLAGAVPTPAPCTGAGEAGFVVYYTASLNGNLDGCTCPTRPRAGLVKRAAYLRALPDRAAAILVDAGDIFDVLPDDLAPGIILDVYGELGYDAVAVGDQELANGSEALLALKRTHPLLSNNLTLCPSPSVCSIISTSPIIVTRPAGSVGICALIDPEVFALSLGQTKDEVKITEPRDVAAALRARLEGERVDLSILLFHGSFEAAERLAREVPGFDLIVVGHEQRLFEPLRAGSTLIVSPGEEGNRVGRIEFRAGPTGAVPGRNAFRLLSYSKDPDDPTTRARVDAYLDELRSRLKK